MPIPGWLYNNYITINPQTGAGPGYQVEVDVLASSLGGLMRSDFGDIRFTSSDGSTQLNYWLKSYVANTSAVFIVQIIEDLSSVMRTIYIWYGNAGATTTSNKFTTYDTWDDISSDKTANYTPRRLWDGHNGPLVFGSGFYTFTSPATDEYAWEFPIAGSTQGYEFVCDYKFSSINSGGDNAQFGVGAYYQNGVGVYLLRDIQLGTTERVDIGKQVAPASHTEPTLYSTAEANCKISGNVYTFTGRFWINNFFAQAWDLDASHLKTTSGTDSSYTTGTVLIYSHIQGTTTLSIRNILLRHYTSPEPTVNTFGPIGLDAPGAGSAPSAPTLVDPANGRTIP
jgi:hypothetical protein